MEKIDTRLARLEEAERKACGLYHRLTKPGVYLDGTILKAAKKLCEEAKTAMKRYLQRSR